MTFVRPSHDDRSANAAIERVALYVRSSPGANSLDLQEARLRQYIDQHPELILVGVYHDTAHSTSCLDCRPNLRRALQAAASSKFDTLMATELPQLNRRADYLMGILEDFDALSVKVRCPDGFDSTSALGRLTAQMFGLFLEWEHEKQHERAEMEQRLSARRAKIPASPAPLKPITYRKVQVRVHFAKRRRG